MALSQDENGTKRSENVSFTSDLHVLLGYRMRKINVIMTSNKDQNSDNNISQYYTTVEPRKSAHIGNPEIERY